ncbi:hypothetical protein C1752_00615 [Acaryochloris thomasi RCC1774]|uniref:DUF3611 family protein n=1 Tax=Acaryochloris thomasi RCC1774 TaxID=1764569 RepID=A0A2W1K438_9CYAN|nr:DUF3611 family protein [Acaryochloris thomasi]PZD74801.1 hypothetical protein C1752_00615 [Acaryochloris thomasi RCC1774]
MQNTVPSRKQFSGPFRWLSRISFWFHLVLGGSSVVLLAIAGLSRGFSAQTRNPLIGVGILCAVCALLVLGFRTYWAFRYTRLAKQLRATNADLRPQRGEIVKVLQTGLAMSFVGMLLAFLASEATAVAVLGKTLAQPQGVAMYTPQAIVRSLDILLVLANINILGAHLLGSLNSLGLLHWITE